MKNFPGEVNSKCKAMEMLRKRSLFGGRQDVHCGWSRAVGEGAGRAAQRGWERGGDLILKVAEDVQRL